MPPRGRVQSPHAARDEAAVRAIPNTQGRRQVRHVLIDTDYWKSFVHARLVVAMGDPGCLSLFGRKSTQHQLLAKHLTAEYRVRTEARGRVVDEWELRANSPDMATAGRESLARSYTRRRGSQATWFIPTPRESTVRAVIAADSLLSGPVVSFWRYHWQSVVLTPACR